MPHAIDATSRAPSAALETHRAPRTKSFAAKPLGTTSATISPAAQAAFAAPPPEAATSPAPAAMPATTATPAAAVGAAAAKAYRSTATAN